MYCNQGFKNLVCSLRVHNIYLYWYLKNNTDYLNSLGRGATFKEISKQIVEDIVIPVPPIPTQQKIATTLDTVADILRLRKAQLEQLDLLVKARFVEMFGDPVENPKGWEVATLRAVANRISDGPFGSNLKSEHYSEQGVRVIRLQNIGSSEFIDIDKVFIPNDHYGKLKKYTCLPGDIVIGTLGDPNLRACIIPAHINKAINKADCVHFVPNPKIINTQFACLYINQPEVLTFASGSIHGQTRTRISMSQVAALPIIVPPLPLQSQFATFVTQVDHLKQTVRQAIAETQTLFDSLMSKYFA